MGTLYDCLIDLAESCFDRGFSPEMAIVPCSIVYLFIFRFRIAGLAGKWQEKQTPIRSDCCSKAVIPHICCHFPGHVGLREPLVEAERILRLRIGMGNAGTGCEQDGNDLFHG